MNSRILLLVFCLFLIASSLNAEEPSLRLVPTGVITGPTDVVVEAVMPTEGSLVLGAAVIVFQYDPGKVVISDPRVSAGWDAPTTNANTTAGLYHAVTCNADGQSATGTLLTLTISPTGTSADLSDCDTFQLLGGDPVTDMGTNISASDANGFYSYYPPGSCGGSDASTGGAIDDESQETSDLNEIETDSVVVPDPPPGTFTGIIGETIVGELDGSFATQTFAGAGCQADIVSAINALRIAGGLSRGRPKDIAAFDRNDDGLITIADVALILKAECSGPVRWWFRSFVNAMCSNQPAIANIDRDLNGRFEVIFTSDYLNPLLYEEDPDREGNPQQVWVVSDASGTGDYGDLAGWPRRLRDAPRGLAAANFAGNTLSQTDPWEVFGVNFQDNYDIDPDPNVVSIELFSHLYVWTALGGNVDIDGGGQDFANGNAPDLETGKGVGHSVNAPAVYDFNNDGFAEAFFHYQGQRVPLGSGFIGGGLKALAPYMVNPNALDKMALFQTGNDPGENWYVAPTDALFNNPPVFPNLDTTDDTPSVTRNVTIASESGYIYAWDVNGNPASGWESVTRPDMLPFDTSNPTPYTDYFEYVNAVYPYETIIEPSPMPMPIAAGNVDGQAGDEVIGASGDVRHFWGFSTGGGVMYPLGTQDGAIYCWKPDGRLKWRYPAYVPGLAIQGFLPAFTSGVSLGRLNGPTGTVAVVVGNADGEVFAINGATGALMWKFQTHAPMHIAYRQIRTEPLIFDLNGDGYQDVVVGTSDGRIYALKGNTSNPAGEVLWESFTFAVTGMSEWTDDITNIIIYEKHNEEVLGMAVGPLYGNDPTRAVLVVCSSALQLDKASPIRGHALFLDLGTGSWNADAADWPQWQRTCQRTGTIGLP